MKTLNCKGQLIDFSTPKIMGIINITPDSFFSGSRKMDQKSITDHVYQMKSEGLDILDIGAMTSKPGAPIISIEEEVTRLKNALKIISKSFPDLIISIDTFRSEVVKALSAYNIHIINDISGGNYDPEILAFCAKNNFGYVMMHMQGLPENMQTAPTYNDVTLDILIWLKNQIKKAHAIGLNNILIDPGFGFGKTVDHNYELLKNLKAFEMLNCPILAGVSRKSMITKVLNIAPSEALNGTTALHMVALQNGAKVLRVHDVKAAKETIQLWKKINDI